jgi:hypothetical protein
LMGDEDILRKLERALDEAAAQPSGAGPEPIWRPQRPGERVVGKVVEIREVPTRFGKPVPLIILEDLNPEHKRIAVVATATIRKYLQGVPDPQTGKVLKITKGKFVAIQYMGERQGIQSGREYKDYRVVVEDQVS